MLIREVNYLRRPEQVRLLKGAAQAVRLLRRSGWRVVVITNQSGVARGYLSLSTLARVHARLRRELRDRGARLDGLFVCPHGPRDGCACRKPRTALIKEAARRLKLDVSRSYFVGDTTTDLKTARNAGCVGLLVRTGKGGRDGRFRVRPRRAFKNLAAAARWLAARGYWKGF